MKVMKLRKYARKTEIYSIVKNVFDTTLNGKRLMISNPLYTHI